MNNWNKSTDSGYLCCSKTQKESVTKYEKQQYEKSKESQKKTIFWRICFMEIGNKFFLIHQRQRKLLGCFVKRLLLRNWNLILIPDYSKNQIAIVGFREILESTLQIWGKILLFPQ